MYVYTGVQYIQIQTFYIHDMWYMYMYVVHVCVLEDFDVHFYMYF